METITPDTTNQDVKTPLLRDVQLQPQSILKEQKKQMRVLLAVDETDDSFYALKWVLDNLCKHMEEQYHLIVVHVVQIFPQYFFPGGAPVGPTIPITVSATKVQKENAAILLSRALQICQEKNIVAESVILESADPKEEICEATEAMNACLLVVGSRGLGKIKRAFLGSVSDYCAHHAKCPVLIVKRPKELLK